MVDEICYRVSLVYRQLANVSGVFVTGRTVYCSYT